MTTFCGEKNSVVQDCAANTAGVAEYRKFATPQMRVWQSVMDYDWSYG